MAELVQRLRELEADIRYQELPTKQEGDFAYSRGTTPILLSAPHGAVHTREGRYKEEDEYTAGFARLIAEQTGAYVIWLRRKSDTDPNYDVDCPYKRKVADLVNEGHIRFVLDIHGVAEHRSFGIALGTMHGRSCPVQRPRIIEVLQQHGWEEAGRGLDRLDVDGVFSAGGQATITRHAWKELGVPAAQFEIHTQLRVVERRADATQEMPFIGDSERIARAIHTFTDMVRALAERPSP